MNRVRVVCAALAICWAAIAASGDGGADHGPARKIDGHPRTGDLSAQRRFAWDVVSGLDFLESADRSLSPAWRRSDEIFLPGTSDPLQAGMQSPDRGDAHGSVQSGEPQIIIVTLYNDAAHRHIRDNRLQERAELERLLTAGRQDREIRDNRTIPPFPSDAVVLLTAWWPIAGDGMTAMPVWDPEQNPARGRGNSYATWQRAVAVDRSNAEGTVDIESVGRRFSDARRVSLDAFQYIAVDRETVERTRRDVHAHKAAVIALGRELRVGDYLALVAVHVATKAAGDWAWATLWWHDAPRRGAFAQDRPPTLPRVWRNYLLDVALDAQEPVAADGGARVCFNPWLEARFPDEGAGGGVVSNCVACHGRASYPAVDFLPVTRGAPDLRHDPAYAANRLRTDFLWSLARQAR